MGVGWGGVGVWGGGVGGWGGGWGGGGGGGGFFFQAEDGIRDLVRSRGLGDVYKRQLKVLVLPISSKIKKNSS